MNEKPTADAVGYILPPLPGLVATAFSLSSRRSVPRRAPATGPQTATRVCVPAAASANPTPARVDGRAFPARSCPPARLIGPRQAQQPAQREPPRFQQFRLDLDGTRPTDGRSPARRKAAPSVTKNLSASPLDGPQRGRGGVVCVHDGAVGQLRHASGKRVAFGVRPGAHQPFGEAAGRRPRPAGG